MTPQERLDRLEKYVAYQIDENKLLSKYTSSITARIDELLTAIDDINIDIIELKEGLNDLS